MKKKFMAISFLAVVSIFLFNYAITRKISNQEKEVLLVGSMICIKNEEIEYIGEKEKSKVINTSMQNIGIMTCIDKQTNQYVAFCHKISYNNQELDFENNICCKADYIGVEKAQEKKVGKVNASSNDNFEIGNITKNTKIGVFGEVTDLSVFDEDEIIELNIASRYNIKKGNAKIYINLDNQGFQEYDINIENINYFNETKNIHFKVVDKNLIEKTGGIVRGMSGSPIIQDGKLIGAINCVCEEDSTDAYAIFADKLF